MRPKDVRSVDLPESEWVAATRRYYGIFGFFYLIFGLLLLFLPRQSWSGPSYDAAFDLAPKPVHAVIFVFVSCLIAWALITVDLAVLRLSVIAMVVVSTFWFAVATFAPFFNKGGAAVGTILLWGFQIALHLNASFTEKKLAKQRRL